MKNIIFMHGPSGSGKSTHAVKLIEQQGGRLLHCDHKELSTIFKLIEHFPNSIYYYDGIKLELLEAAINNHKDDNKTHLVFMAPLYFLEHNAKYLNRTKSEYEHAKGIYLQLEELLSKEKVILYNVLTMEVINRSDFSVVFEELSKPIESDDLIQFEEMFDKLMGADNYHDIYVLGKTFKGQTEANQTWNILKEMCEFRNTSVYDIGACTGFFAFRIFVSGARSIIATDVNIDRLKIMREVMRLNQAPVSCIYHNISKEFISVYRDYTLVLNLYHWLEAKKFALNVIFNLTRVVIFELNNEHIEEVNKFAESKKYFMTKKIKSRANRHIVRWDKK